MLNEDETRVVNTLGEAWNQFCELYPVDTDEFEDFRRTIHAAQALVMSRPVRKKIKQERQNG